MTATSINRIVLTGIAALAMAVAGCGQVSRTGRSPVQVVINILQAASGAEPDKLSGTLYSDVVTVVTRTVNGTQVQSPTVFSDNGQVVMQLINRDPGQTGIPLTPTLINQVTFTRYRVVYVRADGRNTPGVDVPYPWDGAATFTVPADGTITANFELVRHIAKGEAPLVALASSALIISTQAEITFYGRDQAGNNVTAVGRMQVEFGNFGDPQ